MTVQDMTCGDLTLVNEEEFVRHQVKTYGQQRPKAGSCCGLDFYTSEGLRSTDTRRTVHNPRAKRSWGGANATTAR